MPDVKLKYQGGERVIDDTISIGRTPDNTISFPDDPNVSRNHAEIERRGDYFCLVDLGSSNGTTVNGQPVTGDLYLWDGAEIELGGSAKIEVVFLNPDGTEPERPKAETAEPAADAEAEEPAPAPQVSVTGGSRKTLFLAGGVFALAVVFAAGTTAIYFSTSSSACDARASIVSHETGDTIIGGTEVEVELQNGSCVGKVILAVDGIEIATVDGPPYTAKIDPAEYPEFSDGFDHGMSVILEDEAGNRLPQSEPVLLAFETRAADKPREEKDVAGTSGPVSQPQRPTNGSVSLIEVHEMTKQLMRMFPANANYNVSNRQLLQEVQRKAAEYAQEGYFERASKYRDPIIVAFVREQNLNAPLGFVLAMSRSKFVPDKKGSDEGLWQMADAFADSNGYKGLCGNETLLDPKQECAAEAAALYMKALIFSVFDGDVIYSVAAFGKSPQDAGTWKSTLPANRADISNVLKSPAEREQIVRFLAAGIVTENPEKFGLSRDRKLSELYRIAM